MVWHVMQRTTVGVGKGGGWQILDFLQSKLRGTQQEFCGTCSIRTATYFNTDLCEGVYFLTSQSDKLYSSQCLMKNRYMYKGFILSPVSSPSLPIDVCETAAYFGLPGFRH